MEAHHISTKNGYFKVGFDKGYLTNKITVFHINYNEISIKIQYFDYKNIYNIITLFIIKVILLFSLLTTNKLIIKTPNKLHPKAIRSLLKFSNSLNKAKRHNKPTMHFLRTPKQPKSILLFSISNFNYF